MQKFIAVLFSPALFGIAFLGPLIAQVGVAFNVAPAQTSTYIVGVLIGGLWGVIAQLRGSWIWVRP